MNIDKDTEETARQLFYQLAEGAKDNISLQTIRNTKAICLILATLSEKGLITDAEINDIIVDARY